MSEQRSTAPGLSEVDLEAIRKRIAMAQRIFGVSFDGYPDTERAPVDIQRDRDRSALMREVERLRAALHAATAPQEGRPPCCEGKADSYSCACACHSFPEHGKLQDALEALKFYQTRDAHADAVIQSRNQRLSEIAVESDRLRAALVGLVGVDGREDLEQLEAAMRLMPAPAADKAVTIDAIHALIATLPAAPQVAQP